MLAPVARAVGGNAQNALSGLEIPSLQLEILSVPDTGDRQRTEKLGQQARNRLSLIPLLFDPFEKRLAGLAVEADNVEALAGMGFDAEEFAAVDEHGIQGLGGAWFFGIVVPEDLTGAAGKHVDGLALKILLYNRQIVPL